MRSRSLVFLGAKNFENTKEDTVPSNKVLRLVLRE
jgi:hypothetical protein